MNESLEGGVVAALQGGDPIVVGVLYMLLLLSVVTWFIIIYKALEVWRTRRACAAYARELWDSGDAVAFLQRTAAQSASPLASIAAGGHKALHNYLAHQGAAANVAGSLAEVLTRALRQTIQDQQTHFEKGLGILATVGNTAPFIGLFGTVIGIMSALQGIASSGSADLQIVAGPIGEALVATAAGIGCAIPAVVGYNSFLRRLRVMRNEWDSFAYDVLVQFASEHALTRVAQQIAKTQKEAE